MIIKHIKETYKTIIKTLTIDGIETKNSKMEF